MASACASMGANKKSKTKKIFKAVGRAVQNILFAGNKVYDASALPEPGSLEYPQEILDEPMYIQKSLEQEKCLLYLTCVLEKVKILSAENKLLKRKIQVLLRKNGKLKIRSNVDLNNNNKKWQISSENNCYQTESMKYCSQQDLRMLRKKIENLVKDQTLHSDVLRRNKCTQTEGPAKCIDAETQHEDRTAADRLVLRKRHSKKRPKRWSSRIPVRCKVSPVVDSSPSKIPAPTFQTPPRSDSTHSLGRDVSSRFDTPKGARTKSVSPLSVMNMLQRRSLDTSSSGADSTHGDKLLYLPSLLATIVSKTADKVKSVLNISWSSLFNNSLVDEQCSKILGKGKDTVGLALALCGIQNCIQRIFQYVSRQTDSRGNTLLHLLAGNGKFGMWPTILENCRSFIDSRNFEGQTPLILAAGAGCADSVRQLLEAGADLNAQDSKGRTALMAAVRGQHERVVRLLVLQRGISIFIKDADGVTAVDLAIRSDSVEIQCCFLMHTQMCT